MDQVKLTREELIEYAKVFHETAYKANSYLSVLSQFGEYVTEYNDQINVSPTFYGIVYHALIGQLYLELGKLYDTRKDCFTLRELITQIENNLDLFPCVEEIEYDNWRCIDVKNKKFEKERGIDTIEKHPDLDFEGILRRYKVVLGSMQTAYIKRSKQYAHNVKGVANGKRAFCKDYIENVKELRDQINFAFELSDFVITELTGLIPAFECVGQDDWVETLRLVKEQQKNEASYDDQLG